MRTSGYILSTRIAISFPIKLDAAFFLSGVEPEKPSLRFEDIEAEVSEAEAHTRYATVAVAFIVNQMLAAFDEATAQVPNFVSQRPILLKIKFWNCKDWS